MNKESHKAAMLIHNIASGVAALDDLPIDVAVENKEALHQIFVELNAYLIRLHQTSKRTNETASSSDVQQSL